MIEVQYILITSVYGWDFKAGLAHLEGVGNEE